MRFLIIASCNWFVKCYNMKNMIEHVKIQNFQSHKSTEMSLSDRVNSIQGNSDCGKSAVMRALNWLIFNPAGDYFVSDWARKGKSLSAPCEVSVSVGGHTITRKRDKDFNGYILDGQVFEATRNSVPPQVAELLGLGEVNIQRQLDPPFLISKSSGDVSRYINSLVNLTRIDEWTTAANSRGRALSQKVDSASARAGAAQKEVDSYAFLPELEELSSKLTEKADSIAGAESEIKLLRNELDVYLIQRDILDGIPDVGKLFELLKTAEKKSGEFESKRAEAEGLCSSCNSFLSVKNQLKSIPDLDLLSSKLSRAGECKRKIDLLEREERELSSSIERMQRISVSAVPESLFETIGTLERYRNVRSRILESVEFLQQQVALYEKSMSGVGELEKELAAVEAQLSTMVCPLCGRRGIHEEE